MIPKNNEDFLMTVIGNNIEILNINNSILNTYNNYSIEYFKDFIEKESIKYNFEIIFSSNIYDIKMREKEIKEENETINTIDYRIIFTEETDNTRLKHEFFFHNNDFDFYMPLSKENFPEIQVSIITTELKPKYNQVEHLMIQIDSGGFNVVKEINPTVESNLSSGLLEFSFSHYNNSFIVRRLKTPNIFDQNKKYTDCFNKNYEMFANFFINNKTISVEHKDIILLESDMNIPDISIQHSNLSLKDLISRKMIVPTQKETLKRKI